MYLTLAVNYLIGKDDPWGYHLVNLIIHILAGFTLFGILKRSFLNKKFAPEFGYDALGLSLTIVLIWLVHPLQTQSVTYIIQRAEAQMGLFFLLSLYCAIRRFELERHSSWELASVFFCILGLLTIYFDMI